MDQNWLFFAVAISAVLLAGVSKGGFGSGAAFAATPILALIMVPQAAVGLMLPLLMIMDMTSLRPYWKKWDWRNARAMMIAAVPGVVLGVMFFRWANADVIRILIGAIALGFIAFDLARRRGVLTIAERAFSPLSAGLAGMTAGFTSFVSHAGGPPAAVHLLSQGLTKNVYQATTVLVFWWINLVKIGPFLALGLINPGDLGTIAMLAPVAIVGTLIGVFVHNRITEGLFFGAIYVLLGLTGLRLIYVGLSGLLT